MEKLATDLNKCEFNLIRSSRLGLFLGQKGGDLIRTWRTIAGNLGRLGHA